MPLKHSVLMTFTTMALSATLLTACGGGSKSSTDAADNPDKLADIDQTLDINLDDELEPAAGFPASDDDKQKLAEKLALIWSVKDKPLFLVEQPKNDVLKEKQSCTTGSTSFAKSEGGVDASFNNCVVKPAEFSTETYQGSLNYRVENTEVGSTENYSFTSFSSKKNSFGSRIEYSLNGNYQRKYEPNNGDTLVKSGWGLAFSYQDSSGSGEFESVGEQTSLVWVDSNNDLNVLSSHYKVEFSQQDSRYRLEFEFDEQSKLYQEASFYTPEFGLFTLEVNETQGVPCSRNGKSYIGINATFTLFDENENSLTIDTNCGETNYR